jgi:hypothetical protein
MDHKLAVTQQSVEKYTLNELSPDERRDFEEHMFDCPICSDLVRQNFTVAENLKEVLLENRQLGVASERQRSGWFNWRVAWLAPTFAGIAAICGISYQSLRTAPGAMAQILPQKEVPRVDLLQPAARGAGSVPVVHINRKTSDFVLPLNVDTLPACPLSGELDDAKNRKLTTVSGKLADPELPLRIQVAAKRFPAGRYQVILRCDSDLKSAVAFPFAIAAAN